MTISLNLDNIGFSCLKNLTIDSIWVFPQVERNREKGYRQNRDIWTLYSRTYTQLPVGWRREVEGSTPAIRLQRPFIIIRDFLKKNQVKITMLLKNIKQINNDL